MRLDNKNILVTGADGFIGSHLVEQLINNSSKVRALAYYNSFNNWGWLEDIHIKNELEILTGDIRDPCFCSKIMRNIDVVFNLAALVAVPYSYLSPDSYIDTNIRGGLNIYQAALSACVERVVQVSTGEVYGNARSLPVSEGHPLDPRSPYSASKIGSDMIALSFYYSYGLPVTIARPFNTYGPRQSARAVIPSIIIQIASSFEKISLGDLETTRDFSYVKDICRALVMLSESDQAVGQAVNIGSGKEISIKKLLHIISRLMDREAEVIIDSSRLRAKESEIYRQRCDTKKIKKYTDYKPEFTLEQGLTKTIEWFNQSENLKKYKPGIYNI